MKRHVVVQYNHDILYHLRYPTDRRGATGVSGAAYFPRIEDNNPERGNVGRHSILAYADTEAEAIEVAKAMAEGNPKISYGVAEVKLVYVSQPAEPSCAKFTKDGLLPA